MHIEALAVVVVAVVSVTVGTVAVVVGDVVKVTVGTVAVVATVELFLTPVNPFWANKLNKLN